MGRKEGDETTQKGFEIVQCLFLGSVVVNGVYEKNERSKRAQGCFHIQYIDGNHHRLREFSIGRFHGVTAKYLERYLVRSVQKASQVLRIPAVKRVDLV